MRAIACYSGSLEGVLQRDLDVAFGGVSVGDGAEVGICHGIIRRVVAGDIECVEEVSAEVKALLPPHGEGFKHGHVDLLIAGSAQRHGANVAECI